MGKKARQSIIRKWSMILPLMSRNACNGENGESGEKSPAAGDLNWTPKVAPWRLTIFKKIFVCEMEPPLVGKRRSICMKTKSKTSCFSANHIFAKIASLQGATFGIQFKWPAAGDFSPVSPFSPLHAFLDISERCRCIFIIFFTLKSIFDM